MFDKLPSNAQSTRQLDTQREGAPSGFDAPSRDARKVWKDIEAALLRVRDALEQNGDEPTERVLESVRELTRSAQDLRAPLSPTRVAKLEDPIGTIATTAVATCAPRETLATAAQLMWDHDCGVLPVVDPTGKVVGMITDRDALMAALTPSVALRTLTIESVMSKTLHWCGPDESIGRALQLMRVKKVRRLPVLTKDRRLVGMLSIADVARRLERCPPACTELARALADICEPSATPLHALPQTEAQWGFER